MTSHSKIERLIQKDRDEGVECNFDLHVAAKYKISHGITTRVAIGKSNLPDTCGEPTKIRYAVCPICDKKGHQQGMYYVLNDAISCADGHKYVDPDEHKRERKLLLEEEKAHNVFLHTTMLMPKRYAIISESRTLRENFVRDNRIEDYVIIHSPDDLIKTSDHTFLFLGRPANYMKHPALQDPDVRKILEHQQCVRDWDYAVFDGKTIQLSDKYDLEDLTGDVFKRGQVKGRPAYLKT